MLWETLRTLPSQTFRISGVSRLENAVVLQSGSGVTRFEPVRVFDVLKDGMEMRMERFELELKIGNLLLLKGKLCVWEQTEVNKKLFGAGDLGGLGQLVH